MSTACGCLTGLVCDIGMREREREREVEELEIKDWHRLSSWISRGGDGKVEELQYP